MSRTVRKKIFIDPLLKKGHYHAVKLKEPDVDEQMEDYRAEGELQAQQDWQQQLEDDEEIVRGED